MDQLADDACHHFRDISCIRGYVYTNALPAQQIGLQHHLGVTERWQESALDGFATLPLL